MNVIVKFSFMEIIGIIASVIAAVAAIIALWYTIGASKGNILKRIDRKERQIQEIDNQLVRLYGLNRGSGGFITPLDAKKSKLKAEIAELKRRL